MIRKKNCNYHNDKIIFIKIGTYTAHHRKNQCHSKEEKENLVHSWFTNIFHYLLKSGIKL